MYLLDMYTLITYTNVLTPHNFGKIVPPHVVRVAPDPDPFSRLRARLRLSSGFAFTSCTKRLGVGNTRFCIHLAGALNGLVQMKQNRAPTWGGNYF